MLSSGYHYFCLFLLTYCLGLLQDGNGNICVVFWIHDYRSCRITSHSLINFTIDSGIFKVQQGIGA
jgi:hypothetical protein